LGMVRQIFLFAWHTAKRSFMCCGLSLGKLD
jgi:hypothetical protein